MNEIAELIKGGTYVIAVMTGLLLLYVITALIVNYVEKH